ncbi:MAG: hypothetical protein ACTTH6_03145 [Candidatus Altimarinota bacterium]
MEKLTKLFAFLGFFMVSVSQVLAHSADYVYQSDDELKKFFIICLFFGILFLVAMREFHCWYWKISRRADTLDKILRELQKMNEKNNEKNSENS